MANFALPTNYVMRRHLGGLFMAQRQWTAPAGVAQNDTLEAFKLPAGARLFALRANTTVAISSGTIHFGTVADDDAFGASVALATAFVTAEANLRMGQIQSASDDTLIVVKFNSAAVPAATDVVRVWGIMSLEDVVTAAAP